MRKKKINHKKHQLEINDKTSKLIAYTKKETAVIATFDTADLEKVEAFENWRAVWSSEFDCAVIESKDFENGYAKRTPIAAAILSCSVNAPIRHINGDKLDNRRENLEIYDLSLNPNEFKLENDVATIILKDRYGRIIDEAIVDLDVVDEIILKRGVWVKKKRANGQPYVVNPDGILLAHAILDVLEGFVIYENKNPLDNRRKNIKIIEQ